MYSNKYGTSITDSPPFTSNSQPTSQRQSLRPQVPASLLSSNVLNTNRSIPRPKTLQPGVPLALLRSEEERVKTFHSWTVTFIFPAQLAKDGFYSLGEGDKVQCVFCRGCIGYWEENDVISDEHVLHYPQCPYKQGLPVGNVPIGMNPLQVPIPEHYFQGHDVTGNRRIKQDIFYNTTGTSERKGGVGQDINLEELGIESRKRTFFNWPPSSSQESEVSPRSNFTSASTHDIYKNVFENELEALLNWEPAKTVLSLGVERSLVKMVLVWKLRNTGVPFTTPEGLIEAVFSLDAKREQNNRSDFFNENYRSSFSSSSSVFIPRDFSSNLEDDFMQAEPLVDVTPRVEETNVEVFEGGEESGSEEEMSTPTQHIEDQTTQQHSPMLFSEGSGDEDVLPGPSLCENEAVAASPVVITEPEEVKQESSESNEFTVSNLEEENRVLKEQQQCKICMDNEVGEVFLPCGHLVSCVRCALALKDCPVCREIIKGTKRIFMS